MHTQIPIPILCPYTATTFLSTAGSIQLVNEFNSTYPTTSSGRLEIYVRGEWGVVCAETFDQSDADVTCRQNGDSRAYDFGPVGDLG